MEDQVVVKYSLFLFQCFLFLFLSILVREINIESFGDC